MRFAELRVIQASVRAVFARQRGVCAAFDDPSVFYGEDDVGGADRARADAR